MAGEETVRINKIVELATFFIGDALCGIDILGIQEINKYLEMTTVPRGPEYIKGVMNLRGRIVSIIDLGRKLGLSPTLPGKHNRNIIVNSQNEYIGLLVDRIGDVVLADWDKVELPPANIGGVQGKFFEGVFKTDTSLIGILNVEEIFNDEDN